MLKQDISENYDCFLKNSFDIIRAVWEQCIQLLLVSKEGAITLLIRTKRVIVPEICTPNHQNVSVFQIWSKLDKNKQWKTIKEQ